ncbi:carboxypeptidase-like regulatory domain-containing protein [Taibaiella chishuiensis]|uniref:Carboxypeptidase-like protein n=1 Tax=Taibaiella chishuiensis TaxID=1434707 RepID=A0A2P8DCC1_9BACT|nr:carboxypeptidase-like regulatory domain-containing protein [Taibaiella chishuiensis]PSK94878.1 carboxypeptidase-like protein [Taibaiella chishuiensis]
MRLSICILVLCCCCLGRLSAAVLKGIVSDTETGELLAGVLVSNTSRHTAVFTDEYGAFTVEAYAGDTLQISITGYLSRSLVIPLDGLSWFRRIALSKNRIAIDTVVIRPGLSAYQQDSLERRELYGDKLDKRPAKFGLNKPHPLYGGYGAGKVTFNGPLSSIFQKRSKRYKRLKAFQDQFNADEHRRYTESRYSMSTVAALTGLKDQALLDFMNAYPIPYDFARTATDVEVKMWVLYNYRIWSGKRK